MIVTGLTTDIPKVFLWIPFLFAYAPIFLAIYSLFVAERIGYEYAVHNVEVMPAKLIREIVKTVFVNNAITFIIAQVLSAMMFASPESLPWIPLALLYYLSFYIVFALIYAYFTRLFLIGGCRKYLVGMNKTSSGS